jgi:hypothetical protein
VDTTSTDHQPDNPSHPTPRARDLRERLDSAADEGLSQNISRFLRFLGHEDGDVIELQTLGVPNKYAPSNHFTHVRSVERVRGESGDNHFMLDLAEDRVKVGPCAAPESRPWTYR